MNLDFNQQLNKIICTTGRKKEWINVADIIYITVDLTLSYIYIKGKENPYYFVKHLKEFEKELTDCGFFRANGNTLVNGYYVKSIEKENNKEFLFLQNQVKIPLSRRQYSKIRKMIKD
jgi:DNA-binding LytR/AlgR family response regulator